MKWRPWNRFPTSLALRHELKELIEELERRRATSRTAPPAPGADRHPPRRTDGAAAKSVEAGRSPTSTRSRTSCPRRARRHDGPRRLSHIYCPECGFQNPEAANYCARCGAPRPPRGGGDDDDVHARGGGGRGLRFPRASAGPALIVRSGGGRAGETFPLEHDRITIGRSPDCEIFLDDVTVSRKHAADQGRRGLRDRGRGQPERHVREPEAGRVGTTRGRRRAPDRQVPPDLPLAMSATEATRRERLLTIGAVCQRLKDEFPDISISKIRYLEDQGLLAPRRTRGGYRLFSEDDVERLRRILELQRDEFLPLRVIRQELAAPSRQERKRRRGGARRAPRTRSASTSSASAPGSPRELARELEEFGLLEPRAEGGDEALHGDRRRDRGRLRAARALRDRARHLRTFRTAADREATLLEALVAPALRSRNAERRRRPCASSRRSATPRTSSARSSSGAICEHSPLADGRGRSQDQDPRGPRLPEPGIVFKDIMPLLADEQALSQRSTSSPRGRSERSRTSCSAPRRAGSSPAPRSRTSSAAGSSAARRRASSAGRRSARPTRSSTGPNSLELHADAINEGARVLIHDDVLATGGTAKAIELVEQLGGVVVGVLLHHRARVPERPREARRLRRSLAIQY